MDGCGDVYQRDKKELLLDARLFEVCHQYNNMPLAIFLSKIGEVVKQLKK